MYIGRGKVLSVEVVLFWGDLEDVGVGKRLRDELSLTTYKQKELKVKVVVVSR